MEEYTNTTHCHVNLGVKSINPKAFRKKQRKSKFWSNGTPCGSGGHSETTGNCWHSPRSTVCKSSFSAGLWQNYQGKSCQSRSSPCQAWVTAVSEPPSASWTQRSPKLYFIKKEQSARSKAVKYFILLNGMYLPWGFLWSLLWIRTELNSNKIGANKSSPALKLTNVITSKRASA